jgi:hypothetical protein
LGDADSTERPTSTPLSTMMEGTGSTGSTQSSLLVQGIPWNLLSTRALTICWLVAYPISLGSSHGEVGRLYGKPAVWVSGRLEELRQELAELLAA